MHNGGDQHRPPGPQREARYHTNNDTYIAAVSRGFHGLVGLLPMVLGAASGAGLARRYRTQPAAPVVPVRARWGRSARRLIAAAMGVALIALAIFVMQPASTPAITGPDDRAVAGSIAELRKIRLGGHDQWLILPGANATSPVLLYLTGGPGGTDLALNRVYWHDLEQRFVVVSWDQGGVTKSYPAYEPSTTLDVEHAVRDRGACGVSRRSISLGSPGVPRSAYSPRSAGPICSPRTSELVSQTETDRIIYR